MFHDPPATGNFKAHSGHYMKSHLTTSPIDTIVLLPGRLVAGAGPGARR